MVLVFQIKKIVEALNNIKRAMILKRSWNVPGIPKKQRLSGELTYDKMPLKKMDI